MKASFEDQDRMQADLLKGAMDAGELIVNVPTRIGQKASFSAASEASAARNEAAFWRDLYSDLDRQGAVNAEAEKAEPDSETVELK